MPIIHPKGAAAQAVGLDASIAFQRYDLDTATQSVYVFPSVPIGAVATGKMIAILVHALNTSTININSVEVDAGSGYQFLTDRGQTTDPTSNFLTTGLFAGKHSSFDTATTATNIRVTWASSANRCAIGTFAAFDVVNEVPSETHGDTVDPCTATLVIPAGGIALAGSTGFHSPGSTATDWVGLTERYDEFGQNNNEHYSGASDAFASADPALAISASRTGGIFAAQSMRAAVWR